VFAKVPNNHSLTPGTDPRLLTIVLFAAMTDCSNPMTPHVASEYCRPDQVCSQFESPTSASSRIERLGVETKTDEATLRSWIHGHPDDVGATIRLA
jgi:hypothetical protein